MSFAPEIAAAQPVRAPRWPFSLSEARALVGLAAPIMLISLVSMGMSLTDTVMVSALFGTEALAAVSVGSDLYSIFFYLGAGVIGGLAPFYAAAVTRADPAERTKLERTGWMLVGLVGASTIPLVWLAPAWLSVFGLEPELLLAGSGYARAMALTLAPMLGVVLYRTLLTAAEKPKVFLKVTLFMLPLNAAANYVLMTGIGIAPAFGPTGAGVSSFVVAATSLVILVLVHRAGRPQGVKADAVERPEWTDIAAVLRVGIPIGVATLAEIGISMAATLYAARIGTPEVAAHTLSMRMAGVAYAVPMAMLQASLVRTARAESLGDDALGRSVTASSLTAALVIGAVISLVVVSIAQPLSAGFFDASDAGRSAAELTVGLLLLLAVIHLAIGPGSAAVGIMRGRKDARVPMYFTVFAQWCVGAPVGIVLCEMMNMGVTGIWIGLTVGMVVSAGLNLARLFVTSHRASVA
jgi:MATE family multidrug resistance protein